MTTGLEAGRVSNGNTTEGQTPSLPDPAVGNVQQRETGPHEPLFHPCLAGEGDHAFADPGKICGC